MSIIFTIHTKQGSCYNFLSGKAGLYLRPCKIKDLKNVELLISAPDFSVCTLKPSTSSKAFLSLDRWLHRSQITMSYKTSNDIIAGNNNVLQKISRNVLWDTFDNNLLLRVIYGEIL